MFIDKKLILIIFSVLMLTFVSANESLVDMNKSQVSNEMETLRIAEEKAKQELEISKKVAEVFGRTDDLITAHINLSKQMMYVFQGENLLYKWRVSTARRGYVTPKGDYHPEFLERMHYSKRYHNSPMPYSIFFKGNFAIHGTNSIRRLGHRASHGCVRLHPHNAKKLYALVKEYGKKNTFIKITQ